MAWLRKHGTIWYCYWRDGGRGAPIRCQKVGPNRRQAEKIKTMIEARRIEGRIGTGVILPAVLFGDFAKRWWAGRAKRPGTMDRERRLLDNYILPAFEKTLVYEISPDAIAAFSARLAEKSGWTARRAQGLLRTMLATAEEWGYLRRGENTAVRVKLPKKPHHELRPPSVEDVAQLLAAFPLAQRPLLLIGALTGLRWGELIALEWGDVDLEAGKLHVRRQFDRYSRQVSEPKSAASAGTVDLLQPARQALLDLPQRGRVVFPAAAGGYLNHRAWMRRFWHPAVRGLGFGRYRIHDLRHFFASLLIAFGEPLPYVSQQLRHDSPATTAKVYVHLLRENRRLERAATLKKLAEAARATPVLRKGTNVPDDTKVGRAKRKD